ncbi:hypothetical protein J1N35_038154 [Gossypium stocksii]|uniref:Zinc knuckle CX2CX4HX4C domain-containing protein n=1 Tax=Gossypium stocksii TaxID=47602 RepID=A0A9D3ULV7_9ROSI|nr:hypothetical protein J1N35_038154 [Gossypium stocksii]
MAKQFGDFLGEFLEYDTSIPTLGQKNFMRICVRLDVSTPLKWKKKIQIGKAIIVYARFKYEKFSLFFFICGKLGHGESYCPFRLRIKPSKIVFGWDISLRVVARQRNTVIFIKGHDNWRNMGTGDLNGNRFEGGLANLMLEEENDPIINLEGKKRQRIVKGSPALLGNSAEGVSFNLTACSTEQSSHM